jgi:hypothetical protein
MQDLWKENKTGIIITMALLVIGTTYYFITGLGTGMETSTTTTSPEAVAVLKNLDVKVAVADGVALKLFALGSNNALVKLAAAEGESLPEATAIVIGSEEAAMMREEKLFTNTGDRLEGLFGIDTSVGGILEPTGTIIDDMHFASSEQYKKIDGEQGRVFIEFTSDGTPKVFYTRAEDEKMPVPLVFAEGDDDDYKVHTFGGVTYYPVIIGSEEAAMMREEKLFERPGDFIKGFFGQNVLIAGILAPTNTSIDMMHIIPLDADALA